MALIECPDCHGQVSDLAPACPHCGRPLAPTPATPPRTSSRPGRVARLGCLALVVFLALPLAVALVELGGRGTPLDAEELGYRTGQVSAVLIFTASLIALPLGVLWYVLRRRRR
jgi:hypothetical protein